MISISQNRDKVLGKELFDSLEHCHSNISSTNLQGRKLISFGLVPDCGRQIVSRVTTQGRSILGARVKKCKINKQINKKIKK